MTAEKTTPQSRRAVRRIAATLRKLFRSERTRIADEIVAAYTAAEKASRADKILDELNLDSWVDVATKISKQLEVVDSSSGKSALLDLEINDQAMFNVVNELAVDYAETRGAEIVGMTWDGSGYVSNPNPQWSITKTTRDDLRDLVTKAFEDGLSPAELRDAIVNATTFGENRAMMIARTETAMAQMDGAINGWKTSGIVEGSVWELGSEHDSDVPSGDECDDNDGEFAELGDAFPSGDDMPPAHPNCVCALSPVLIPEDEA